VFTGKDGHSFVGETDSAKLFVLAHLKIAPMGC